MTLALEVRDLSFGYEREQRALDHISFRVEAGERVALLGGNGAGKSTLLWCLAGLHPAQGRMSIFGQEPRLAHGKIGLLFQNPEDQLFMPTIEEDLILPQVNRGLPEQPARSIATELLEKVGLAACSDRPARKLSVGQRKRAAIAAALVQSPEMLLLDEPTAELDGRSTRELKQTLLSLPITLLVATHDLAFAAAVASRAILLNSGRIAHDAPIEELLHDERLLHEAGIL